AGVIDASKTPSRPEAKRARDDGSGRTWESLTLDTEHFTHLPDVTGQGTKIMSRPAPYNGSNCVMGWQFTGPFDSSNALYS
ncbi:hypothetical protein JOB18_039001, partial [Solea senegalensis]